MKITRISRENGKKDEVSMQYAKRKLAHFMRISGAEVQTRLEAGETLFTVSYLYRLCLKERLENLLYHLRLRGTGKCIKHIRAIDVQVGGEYRHLFAGENKGLYKLTALKRGAK